MIIKLKLINNSGFYIAHLPLNEKRRNFSSYIDRENIFSPKKPPKIFFIYPETENKKRIVFYVWVFLFMFSDHKKLQTIHDWSNKSNEKKTKSNWTIFVSLFLLRRRTLFLYKLLLYIYIIILVMLIYIFNKKNFSNLIQLEVMRKNLEKSSFSET